MGNPLTVHGHLALIRGEQTNHQVEGGGFSSSIGTKQADHLAGGKLQLQALQQLAPNKGDGDIRQFPGHGVTGLVSA